MYEVSSVEDKLKEPVNRTPVKIDSPIKNRTNPICLSIFIFLGFGKYSFPAFLSRLNGLSVFLVKF